MRVWSAPPDEDEVEEDEVIEETTEEVVDEEEEEEEEAEVVPGLRYTAAPAAITIRTMTIPIVATLLIAALRVVCCKIVQISPVGIINVDRIGRVQIPSICETPGGRYERNWRPGDRIEPRSFIFAPE